MDVSRIIGAARIERQSLVDSIAKLDEVIAALTALSKENADTNLTAEATESDDSHSYPRPKDAVLDAMRETEPGRPVEPKDVTAIVRRRGQFNPTLKSGATAYTTALSRLADDPKSGIHRQGDFYVYLPNNQRSSYGLAAGVGGGEA